MQAIVVRGRFSLACLRKGYNRNRGNLSSELKSLNDWLIDNKLSLHLGKTQSIVFGTRKKLCKCNTLNIVCNGIVIESMSTVTYLGVTLDQSISGDVFF